MKFIFDCEDEIALPACYNLIDDITKFHKKITKVEFKEGKDNKQTAKNVLRAMMVEYPKETSHILSKLWILEKGEKAPNIFKTTTAIFNSDTAIDFFMSAFPSLLEILKQLSLIAK